MHYKKYRFYGLGCGGVGVWGCVGGGVCVCVGGGGGGGGVGGGGGGGVCMYHSQLASAITPMEK